MLFRSMLFKCLLLQKWFKIDSDPELESQINDSIAFKQFLELGLENPSPDHSTFSRFRSRLSKRLFDQLVHNILGQFKAKGIRINEGIAIDARIVRSASRPLKKKKLETLREDRSAPGGELDRTGKLRKFSRDLESNWTVKNDRPYYGMKEHAAVDVEHGFILATVMTPASVHDTKYFSYCTVYSLCAGQPFKKVYADKGTTAVRTESFFR